jgi:hypothetical protein
MKLALQVCLIVSMLLLTIAPQFLGPEYDWRIHTTSESAAQNTENAWIARLGFALYGLAVVALAFSAPPPARLRYLPFAVSMILVVVWSHRPYLPDRTFDVLEDTLHSVAASLVGFSFVLAIALSLFADRDRPWQIRAFHILAMASALALPMVMANRESLRGSAQRLMFFISYVWFLVQVQLSPPGFPPQIAAHQGPS